ncbi:MAG: DUF3306 domain-containing protein, partial [Gammaproteobacteria bacterium]|nr:DUF3306 domain-containing protein [Gammaproteobacteria bacterium]
PLIPESPAEEPASDLPAESAATSGVSTSDLETADLAALDRADDYATPEGANEVSPADAEYGEDLPEEPLLTDEDMPALESLQKDSDVSMFFNRGVSRELRKAALRKLFSLPGLNITDGLNDYDEDYTTFEPLGDIVTSDMRFHAERKARLAEEEEARLRAEAEATESDSAEQIETDDAGESEAPPEENPDALQADNEAVENEDFTDEQSLEPDPQSNPGTTGNGPAGDPLARKEVPTDIETPPADPS